MCKWLVKKVTDEGELSHLGLHLRRWKSAPKISLIRRKKRSIVINNALFLDSHGNCISGNIVNFTCLAMYSSASSTSYFTVLHFAAVISTRDDAWSAFIPCFTRCSWCANGDKTRVNLWKWCIFPII